MNQPLTSTRSTLVKVTDAEKVEDLADLAEKQLGSYQRAVENLTILARFLVFFGMGIVCVNFYFAFTKYGGFVLVSEETGNSILLYLIMRFPGITLCLISQIVTLLGHLSLKAIYSNEQSYLTSLIKRAHGA